jgi:MFS family permease
MLSSSISESRQKATLPRPFRIFCRNMKEVRMSTLHVLKHRGFRNLWLGQAISQLGDAFYFVVFMFMVKKITGRDDMVGFVGATEMAPFLLFGPYAGAIADRLDRRKIMLYSDWICFGILVALAALLLVVPTAPVWALFAVPLILGIARSFFLPAKSAAIPRLVPESDVHAANGLSMTTQSMAPLVGIALSAGLLSLLWDYAGEKFFLLAVLVNATSFLVSAIYVGKMPPVEPEIDREPSHPVTDIVEGFRYIRKRGDLLTIVIVGGLVSLLISPFYPIYVATNDAWFGGKPATLAWFEFSFFLGMISASLWVSGRIIRRPGVSYILGLAVVGFAVAVMGLWINLWAFIAWNVVAGLAIPFAQIPIQSYLQLVVDDQYRGRVNSAITMVTIGMHPVGMAMAGLLIAGVGIVQSYLFMGIGMGVAALLGLLSPSFRNAIMPSTSPAEEAGASLPASDALPANGPA